MEVDPQKLAELTAQFESLNLPEEIGLDPEEAAREELETGEPGIRFTPILKNVSSVSEGNHEHGCSCHLEDSPRGYS